jgi:glutamate-1-semialdehyde 2,1-aminomutase
MKTYEESSVAATRTSEMARRARRRIPGGTQLLSKRPEMYAPDLWPGYYAKARGVEVWDLDGRRYVDMSISGVGACVLGYADPDVNRAVHRAVDGGSMCTLNCPEEVELADRLCELHPWADMVRFARGGGEAMAVAVRIARAYTRRDKVAFCGYHGWHDWYLAANLSEGGTLDGHLLPGLEPSGVPRGLRGTMFPFRYNRADELEAVADRHRGELAAVVMEPVRGSPPAGDFLRRVRAIAEGAGAVLIFDEVTSGFRVNTGGIHLTYGVTPDVAVFAKGLGNGYPVAAVVGEGRVMQAAQGSFISSTFWTDRVGPAAALATLRKHEELDVGSRLVRIGEQVQSGWSHAARAAGLKVQVSGIPPLAHLSFDCEDGQAVATLFTQLMLQRGFLAGKSFYASYAHEEEHVQAYLSAVGAVFARLVDAIDRGAVRSELKGPVAHEGFRRLT